MTVALSRESQVCTLLQSKLKDFMTKHIYIKEEKKKALAYYQYYKYYSCSLLCLMGFNLTNFTKMSSFFPYNNKKTLRKLM